MAKKFEAQLGLDNSEFKRKLGDSEKQMGGFGRTIKGIGASLAAAFSIGAIVNFTKEVVKLAAVTEGVRAGFERLGAPGLLTNLQRATRNTVSDLQLMQIAIKASNFEIPLENLAKLLEFASARAIQTGESVDYLVDSIILGIGRKSPLILDNLGISAVKLREVLKGAGVEMASVGDIAAAVGKIASDEMQKMGDVADTTATRIASLSAAWKNFKGEVGEAIVTATPMQNLAKYLDKVNAMRQVPGMGLFEALFGAKNMSDADMARLNDTLDKQNDLLTEQTNAILAHNRAVSEAQQLAMLKKDAISPFTAPMKTFQKLPGIGADMKTLAGAPAAPQIYAEFSSLQTALMGLADTFASVFGTIDQGFDAMVSNIIRSLQRLVVETLAKAAILTIIGKLLGIPLTGDLYKTFLLGPNINALSKGGVTLRNNPTSSPLKIEVEGVIRGSDIILSNKRYGENN